MSSTTADYCATILTIYHQEPLGMFTSDAIRLVEIGFIKAGRRGRLELTDRGSRIIAKLNSGEEIDDREFGDWLFSSKQIFSPCEN